MIFQLTGTTTYTDEFDLAAAPAVSASTTYTAVSGGKIDVPLGATASTSYSVPFGGITKLRGLRLTNNTDQDLNIKYNGVTASYSLPASSVEVKVFPTDPTTPITAIALVATTTEVADGKIDYVVVGT
jgi:hypothetical protein